LAAIFDYGFPHILYSLVVLDYIFLSVHFCLLTHNSRQSLNADLIEWEMNAPVSQLEGFHYIYWQIIPKLMQYRLSNLTLLACLAYVDAEREKHACIKLRFDWGEPERAPH